MTQQVMVVRAEEGRVLVSAGVAQTLFGQRERRYWADNRLDAPPGTWVEVGQSPQWVLLEVLGFLGLPVLLLFVLYAASGNWFTGSTSNASRVLLSFAGLPLGFLVFKALRGILPNSNPGVLRVLEQEPQLGEGCGNGCVCRANQISRPQIGDGQQGCRR